MKTPLCYKHVSRLMAGVCIGLNLVLLQGCASFSKIVPIKTRQSAPNLEAQVSDPLEGLNRGLYAFNDGVDKVFIGPVAKGYQAAIPRPVRKRVSNFSSNLGEPLNFANELVQFDLDDAGIALSRFLINSTIGLGGLFDVAGKTPELQTQTEDFGQTLGTYGITAGPYLVLPFLGPSNFRDLFGRAGDVIANPVRRINFEGEGGVIAGTNFATLLDLRARQDGALKDIRESADPYVTLRTLYNQRRETLIHEDSDPLDDLADFE